MGGIRHSVIRLPVDSPYGKKYNTDMKTNILYETPSFLVCEKPAGLAVQTVSGYQADMVSELKNYLCIKTGRKNPYVGLVHRLDQPVEGLLAVACTKDGAAELSRQLADGRLRKKYLAVLEGVPAQREGVLANWLSKDGKHNLAQVWEDQVPGARQAQLSYRILEESAGLSLAEIRLCTGRFHQIRAQMAHMGFPLAGDVKYGANRAGIQGVALCAYYLALYETVAGKEQAFVMEPHHKLFAEFADRVRELLLQKRI